LNTSRICVRMANSVSGRLQSGCRRDVWRPAHHRVPSLCSRPPQVRAVGSSGSRSRRMSPLATARSTSIAISCFTCAVDEDQHCEFLDLITVRLVPMVAPNFLRFPISGPSTSEQLREYVQCVIRGTARRSSPRDYDLIEGVRSWTASDQLMKRELILQGMGSGHLPHGPHRAQSAGCEAVAHHGQVFPGWQSRACRSACRSTPQGPNRQRVVATIGDQAAMLVSPADRPRA
jgi:hypothetical protein